MFLAGIELIFFSIETRMLLYCGFLMKNGGDNSDGSGAAEQRLHRAKDFSATATTARRGRSQDS